MNYQAENLVSQEFVYSCQQPVIDDLLESFPVSNESVLNYSKPSLAAQDGSLIGSETGSLIGSQSGPLVMVQTAAYNMPTSSPSLKTTRSGKLKSDLEVKTLCASEINSFFVAGSAVNPVTDLSKQINSVAGSYCDVQSQPMQLTLDNSSRTAECAKAADKMLPHKSNENSEKACNYAMLENWFQTDHLSTLGRHDQELYEQPQTQPLQLTQVSGDLTTGDKCRISSTKKKNVGMGEMTTKETKCTICEKVMSSNKQLKEHLRTHTGERPYSCGECGYSVSKKSNLRAHKRVHSGERPYMCGLCCKLFSQSSHLTSHMVTHTGKKQYECNKCKKLFATNSNLNQHVNKQHNGELKFACEICGDKFSCKSWLEVHRKVHFEKRPYQCDVCKKRFKDKFYVAKHKKGFCGNDGYAKRWKVPGVQKPPGRKRKYKPDQDGLPKRPRGRPKFSIGKRKRLSRKRKIIVDDIEEDAGNLTGEVVDQVVIDQNVPLALNSNSEGINTHNVESACQKFQQYNGEKSNRIAAFPECSLDNFNSVNDSRQLTVETCNESSILELDLSAETILDFTKQESQSLQHCFAEPQNLSSTSSNLRHTNECSGVTTSINTNFSNSLSDINVYGQPQNLSIPQNLSMNHQMSHTMDTVEPQNLSLPQKFLSHPLWELPNIQSENLAEPQNLSLTIEPQNLSIHHSLTQPQNLSLSQSLSQPQNLSHANSVSHNMHHSHINPHVHVLSHVHNLSAGLINTSNSLADPHDLPFSHSQDFTQPQNLTIDQRSLGSGHRNYHIQTQPQDLVLPQNLSFPHIM